MKFIKLKISQDTVNSLYMQPPWDWGCAFKFYITKTLKIMKKVFYITNQKTFI
jgi:hypothetical protein